MGVVKMTYREEDLRKWFRSNWDGWLESYEPRKGGGVGIPDLQILVDGVLVPIELKWGSRIGFAGNLYIDEVEPVQVRWHKLFDVAGGTSWFLVGCDCTGGFEVYLYKAPYVVENWRDGLLIKKAAFVGIGPASNNMLTASVVAAVAHAL